MKKTKLIAAVLLIVVMIISMVACSEEKTAPVEDDKPKVQDEVIEKIRIEFLNIEEIDGVNVISAKWFNNSDNDITFGGSGQLYKKSGNDYEKIGSASRDEFVSLLKPGETLEVKYTPHECEIKAGKTYKLEAAASYLVGDEPWSEFVSVEFEVK